MRRSLEFNLTYQACLRADRYVGRRCDQIGTPGKKKRTKRILTAAQKRERKALKQRLYEQQLQEQLASLPAYTPYWCRGSAAVMGIVMIAQLLDGGIVEVTLAPKAEPKVLQQNMTAARQSYEVTPQSNVMIGPASSSLIHYGAKFGPCMREDIRFKVTFANAVAREQDMQLRCILFSCFGFDLILILTISPALLGATPPPHTSYGIFFCAHVCRVLIPDS